MPLRDGSQRMADGGVSISSENLNLLYDDHEPCETVRESRLIGNKECGLSDREGLRPSGGRQDGVTRSLQARRVNIRMSVVWLFLRTARLIYFRRIKYWNMVCCQRAGNGLK